MVLSGNNHNLPNHISIESSLMDLLSCTQSLSTETWFIKEHSFSVQARSTKVASKQMSTTFVIGRLIASK